MNSAGSIFIVGGYGQVGRMVAKRLAPLFPDRVVIAGRNREKAAACAAEIGFGSTGRALDLFSREAGQALDGAGLALICLDQEDTRFAEQCLSRGVCYVDISADYGFLIQVERLNEIAKNAGTMAVLSVGVAPGLTNLLAARAVSVLDKADRVDIFLQFGLGDHHGEAAIAWIVDNLDARFEVVEGGQAVEVHGFGESRAIQFPSDRRPRQAYRFNFSDQHVIPRTLDVTSASTWMCFDDRFSTWLFSALSKSGLSRLLHRPRWRAAAIWIFANVHLGSDICAVVVRAAGQTGGEARIVELAVVGRKEALMTAVVAAETVNQVMSKKPVPGVFHSEQVIESDPVLAALKSELPDMEMRL